MSTDRLGQNLRWLADHASADTVKALREADAAGAALTVTATAGGPDWRWQGPGGALALHSRRDPAGEAQRQLEAWLAAGERDVDAPVIVVGLAGAWHLRALLDRLGPQGSVFLADNDPAAVKAALAQLDLADLPIAGRAVHLCVADDLHRIGREFRRFLAAQQRFQASFFLHPGSRRARPEAFVALQDRLGAELRAEAMNRSTLAAFADEWQQNVLLNLPTLATAPGVAALRDAFAGVPAVVVAAGPSLHDCLPYLRDAADRALIVSVGTALGPLLAAGVRPHLAVAVDSDPKVLRQFAGLDLDDIRLVAADSIHPDVLAAFGDRVFAFSATLREYASWLTSFGAYPGRLSIGGTVALTALDLAVQAGCEPVICCGLDLAFAADGTTHAKHSMYDGQRAAAGTVGVPGNHQPTVPTSRQFATYIDLLSDYLAEVAMRKGTTVHNANSGGARIHGAPVLAPAAIPDYLGAPGAGHRATLAAIAAAAPTPEPATVQRAVGDARDSVRRLEDAARRALKLSRRLEKTAARGPLPERDLCRLQRLDRRLKAEDTALLLLDGAVKRTTMRLLADPIAAGDSAAIMARSCELYDDLRGAADWIAGFLDRAAERLGGAAAGQPAPRTRRSPRNAKPRRPMCAARA